MDVVDLNGTSHELSDLQLLIQQKVMAYKDEAQVIVDEYYVWWRANNKEVLNLMSLGEKVKTGEIAPFIRVHRLNGKVYLTWVLWPRVTVIVRERHKKTFCKQITPRKRGYSIDQLELKCQLWEINMVTETESKLSTLRDKLDLLHKMKVDINRLNKKLNN